MNRDSTRTALLVALATGLAATPAYAQDYVFRDASEIAREVGRVGSAILVEAEGPRLYRTGPIILEHGSLRNRWVMVQDSTMGVVFTEPSGVKMNASDYDGDLELRALTRIVAVEVRALLFNIWGDYAGQVTATRPVEAGMGQTWGMDPRWVDIPLPAVEHRSSVTWVHRVMFPDGSVFEADMGPVLEAARVLTGKVLEEVGDPIVAMSRR